MKVVAILQARMNSTRLPGKVVLPLAGKSILQNIIERVQRATRINVVALTIPNSDYEAFYGLNEVDYLHTWEGDEADLVGRYLQCATNTAADVIVRIPCDNPCIDYTYIDRAIREYTVQAHIYYSNTTDLCAGVWVDGIGAEVFSYSRLQWLDARTKGKPTWREHPHRYFEDHGLLTLPKAELRLDVNTQEDYDFIKSIYDHFGHNRFTTREILEYVRQTNR